MNEIKIQEFNNTKWIIGDKIEKGKHAFIHEVIDREDCVIKIQKNDNTFINEIGILYRLQNEGIVPHIHDYWTYENEGFIVMDRLKMTLHEWFLTKPSIGEKMVVYNETKELYQKLHQQKIAVHGIHNRNIMLDFGGIVRLIDFGDGHDYNNRKKHCMDRNSPFFKISCEESLGIMIDQFNRIPHFASCRTKKKQKSASENVKETFIKSQQKSTRRVVKKKKSNRK